MRELEVVTAAVAADGLARAAKRRGKTPAEPDPGVKHANLHTECLNCGATLHGRYCQDCGQSDDDHHRSIFHLIWEAIEGLTHLDGRLMRTLPPLFLRPGQLAKDHFEGRRQRHVPPFRLFLITLLIFMFALELRTHHKAHEGAGVVPVTISTTDDKPDHPTAADADRGADADEAKTSAAARAAIKSLVKPTPTPAPSQPAAQGPVTVTRSASGTTVKVGGGVLKVETDGKARRPGDMDASQGFDQMDQSKFGKTPFGHWLAEHGRRSLASKEYFKATMFEWGHRLAILMLPIFAGFLALCYFYKRQFYIYDHLVVAMHFLSFTFLLWAVAYLIPDPVGGLFVLAATIWTPVNLFMTLRGAYGSSIVGAGLKTFGLWVATLSLFLTLLLGVIFIAMGSM